MAKIAAAKVMITADTRGLDRGFAEASKKTKAFANELNGLGSSSRGGSFGGKGFGKGGAIGGKGGAIGDLLGGGAGKFLGGAAFVASAIATADLMAKAFDARHIDEFANALKEVPIIGGLVRSAESTLGVWTGITAEIQNTNRQTEILNKSHQHTYEIARSIREANAASGLRVAAMAGQAAVADPSDRRSRLVAGDEESRAARRRDMEERFRHEREKLREEGMTGEGAEAASDARKQMVQLSHVTAKNGMWRSGDTFAQKVANWWNPARVKNAEAQEDIAQNVIAQNAKNMAKARAEMDKRQQAERAALARQDAAAIRDRKFAENETLRPMRDAIALGREKLTLGDRAMRIKSIELDYEKQIAAAEHERNKPLVELLRARQEQAVAEERRTQNRDRSREQRGISTEIAGGMLRLVGQGEEARRMEISSDTANRKADAAMTLKGDELQGRLRQLDMVDKIRKAEIAMSGTSEEVWDPSVAMTGPRVSFARLGDAQAARDMAAAVKVDGWDQQMSVLERIAAAVERGVAGRAQ